MTVHLASTFARPSSWTSLPPLVEVEQGDFEELIPHTPAETIAPFIASSAGQPIFSTLEESLSSSRAFIAQMPDHIGVWLPARAVLAETSRLGMHVVHSVMGRPNSQLHPMMLVALPSTNMPVIECSPFILIDLKRLVQGRLAWRMITAHAEAEIDVSSVQDGVEALDDGLRLSGSLNEFGKPDVCVSDDGALTLEWSRDGNGVLVVFVGGGTATYSTRSPKGFYSSLITEFSVLDGLPDPLRAALEQITST